MVHTRSRASSTGKDSTMLLGCRFIIILLALLFAILPTIWFIKHRRRKPGHCKCGYDLRGNPEAVVCPECGEAIADAQSA